MQYTVIREIIRYSMWNKEYTYKVSEQTRFSASTNYRKNIKKALWYAECNDKWRLEQTNTLIKWTDFIPVVNAFVTFFQHRKYNIFCNDICVGTVDKVREKGKITNRARFIIHGQEYFVCNGNTNVIRPWKEYEWTVEKQGGEVLAIVKKPSNEAAYKLEILVRELSLEILGIMIMMSDVHRFSGIEPVTSMDFN